MPQTRVKPDRSSTYSTPRWVKVFGIIALILALLVGIILFTGVGGPHGPGRHVPSGGAVQPHLVTLVATPTPEEGSQQP